MLAWLVPSVLLAGEARGATLTVEDAVSRALERNGQVEAAEAGVRQARANLDQRRLAFGPGLTLSAGYTRLDQVPYVEFDASDFLGGGSSSSCDDISEDELPTGWTVEMAQDFCQMLTSWLAPPAGADTVTRIDMGVLDNYFVKATAEQVLFAGGAIRQGARAAREQLAGSEEQLRATRQEVAWQAEQAFYGLLAAREGARVAGESEETARALVRDIENLVEVGMASRADLLAAKAQASQARLQRLRAEQGAAIAERVLRVLVGLDEAEPLELVPLEPIDVLPLDERRLLDLALRNRPDLAALRHGEAALDHGARAAVGGWLPALVVQGNLNWRNPNYALEPVWYRSADLTLAASWALWDRGASLEQARAARANRDQLAARRRAAEEMLEVEIARAVARVRAADEAWTVARDGEAQARAAYEVEHDSFEAGMANRAELLAAQAALAAARMNVLQADTERRLARAALRKAVGLDPEVDR